MFDRNSKLACHVHECHHHMDFKNVEVVGHEAHYHPWLFLEAWMSVKDPNTENDPTVIPEVASTHLQCKILLSNVHTARATFLF